MAAIPSTSFDPTSTSETTPQGLSLLFEKSFVSRCINSNSSKEKQLIYVLRNKQRYLNILKKQCKKYKSQIEELLCDDVDELVNDIFKKIPAATLAFILMQLKAAKPPPKGRRWTLQEKTSTIALLNKSLKSYSLLRRFVALPSLSTLTRLLSKIPFHTGINEHLFQHLANCLDTYKKKEGMCCLVFDEMYIREHIYYNSFLDGIEGVVDLGNQGKKSSIASRALVFMAQGVVRKWKQPIAYYFTHTDICSDELEFIIRKVIDSLLHVGVPIVATICDMKKTNVNTLRKMGSSASHPYFIHEGSKIFTIFDPPHLLKSTRDLFLKHPISFPYTLGGQDIVMTARWTYINTVYEADKNQRPGYQVLYKLTRQHLAPVMQSKMKVSLAAQVLSRSVAAFIESKINIGALPSDASGTSTFVMLMNNLFDSFNGNSSSTSQGVPGALKSSVSRNSSHLKFWDEAYKCIQSWSFVGSKRRPPVQDGWLTTIGAVKGVWQILRQKGFNKLHTRTLNQDSLENLFAAVRSGCGNNNPPTVQQFVSSLKIQILNGLREELHGTNCEGDDLELLSNLQSFLDVEEERNTPSFEGGFKHVSTPEVGDRIVTEIVSAVLANNMESLSVAYVSGNIACKILAKSNCAKCSAILTSDASLPCNLYISMEELSNDQSRLTYPSEKLVIAVGHGITLIEQLLPNKLKDMGLREKLALTLSEQIDFAWLDCISHFDTVQKCIVEVVCCIGIPWYCKRLIREMKARTISRRVQHQ